MSLVISDALAQAPAPAGGQPGLLGGLLVPAVLIVIFYFLLIRPQTKRTKEHKQMVESLKKGDEVVTSGGLLGRITEIGENFIHLEVAEGLQLKVQKGAVTSLMPKGTVKSEL